MPKWSLAGIIITLVAVLVLVSVIAANVHVDPVFIQNGASGTDALNQAGVYGKYAATDAPTDLLSIMVGNVASFFASGVQSLFKHVFWNW